MPTTFADNINGLNAHFFVVSTKDLYYSLFSLQFYNCIFILTFWVNRKMTEPSTLFTLYVHSKNPNESQLFNN